MSDYTPIEQALLRTLETARGKAGMKTDFDSCASDLMFLQAHNRFGQRGLGSAAAHFAAHAICRKFVDKMKTYANEVKQAGGDANALRDRALKAIGEYIPDEVDQIYDEENKPMPDYDAPPQDELPAFPVTAVASIKMNLRVLNQDVTVEIENISPNDIEQAVAAASARWDIAFWEQVRNEKDEFYRKPTETAQNGAQPSTVTPASQRAGGFHSGDTVDIRIVRMTYSYNTQSANPAHELAFFERIGGSVNYAAGKTRLEKQINLVCEKLGFDAPPNLLDRPIILTVILGKLKTGRDGQPKEGTYTDHYYWDIVDARFAE